MVCFKNEYQSITFEAIWSDQLHETSGNLEINDTTWWRQGDGLVQERRNSSALAMELRLSCTNPWRRFVSGFPSQWTRNSELWVFSLWLAWTSCWTKSRVTDDLRRHDAHVPLQWYRRSTFPDSLGRNMTPSGDFIDSLKVVCDTFWGRMGLHKDQICYGIYHRDFMKWKNVTTIYGRNAISIC